MNKEIRVSDNCKAIEIKLGFWWLLLAAIKKIYLPHRPTISLSFGYPEYIGCANFNNTTVAAGCWHKSNTLCLCSCHISSAIAQGKK